MDAKNENPENGNLETGNPENDAVPEGPSGDLPKLFQPKYIDQDLKDYHIVRIEEIDEQTDAGYGGGRSNDDRPPPPSYEESVRHGPYRSSPPTYARRTGSLEENDSFSVNDSPVFVPFSPEDRQSFIQRVYFTLSLQLSFVVVFIVLTTFVMSVRDFVKMNYLILLIVGFIFYTVTLFSITCCYKARHTYPINYILLTLLTVGLGTIATIMTVMYSTSVVLYAIIACSVVCFTVSLIAIWMPIDLTKCTALICILAVILIVFALIIVIMSMFGLRYKILDVVFAFISTIIFSIFLMYDTQQIIGGRRFYLDPSEHILGATLLFVDIVIIFMDLLTLLGLMDDE